MHLAQRHERVQNTEQMEHLRNCCPTSIVPGGWKISDPLILVSRITASRITVSQITAICISNFEASPPWLVVGDWCFRRTSKLYKNDHVIEDDDDYRNRLGSMEANNRGNDSDTAMPPSSSTAISWATSKPVWLLDNVNTL